MLEVRYLDSRIREAANLAISKTGAPITHRPAPCVGYSVCYKLAIEPDPAAV